MQQHLRRYRANLTRVLAEEQAAGGAESNRDPDDDPDAVSAKPAKVQTRS
ncbi:hypothetical protein [Corynebacterium lubricantis]|nr:hypothetical protein [Corynebacterium lubricantis]